MSRKVIAYDVGTTSIKTCLFEIAAGENIRFLGSEVADYTLRMLGGGAVEQDPEEWWEAMGQTTRRLLEHSGTAREEIQGISFCSQMQNVVMVDEQGRALRPCISWMDTRADFQFSRCMNTGLRVEGLNIFKVLKFLRITGAGSFGSKDPVWKYLWVRDNEPEIFQGAYKWLDAKEYLTCRASGGVSAWPNVREVSEKMDRLVNMPLLPIREEAMARYLDYFDRKCAGSRRMIEEAKQYIPGGVQHNLAFNYPFPLVIDRAEGAYLYDIDGNRYVDYLQAGGPTLLGSNYGPVNDMVWEVVRHSGPVTGLFHEYEMKLAKLIRSCMPSVGLYRCLASGTEADMVAIRIARTFTGKERVVKIGGAYHGWSDQLVYSLHIPYTKTYEAHGIPAAVSGATSEAFPNRIDSLRRVLEENEAHGGTAAVVVEPFGPESGTRLVDRDYNAQVRALCDEFGALLIFDEVVTAFRAGPGGAQGYLGVKPDLTVFGKIVAGGYPMAGGVGGRADVMSCAAAGVKAGKKRAYVGGTLTANPLSCAAGYFAIKEILRTDAAKKAGDNGDKLREGLQGLIDKYELPFVVWNLGSIVHFEVSGVMYLDAKDPDIFRKIPERQKYIEQFGAALTANGVITLAGSRIYTSMADSDDTIAQTLAAFEDVFQNIEG